MHVIEYNVTQCKQQPRQHTADNHHLPHLMLRRYLKSRSLWVSHVSVSLSGVTQPRQREAERERQRERGRERKREGKGNTCGSTPKGRRVSHVHHQSLEHHQSIEQGFHSVQFFCLELGEEYAHCAVSLRASVLSYFAGKVPYSYSR
jgi:hypothetical protein